MDNQSKVTKKIKLPSLVPKKHAFKTSFYLTGDEQQMLHELKLWHRRHASSLLRILIVQEHRRMVLDRAAAGDEGDV